MREQELPESVIRRMQGHAYAYPGTEVGGILVGSFPHGASPETRVVAALPAFDAQGDLTSLTFTHDAWADLHAMKEVQFPNESIVGWYHSHPGHGIFLSEHDLFVHKNFFPQESSVAYVVDPIRHEEGLFQMRQGDLTEVFIRPIDTLEAVTDRRRASRRGPGHQPAGSHLPHQPKQPSTRRRSGTSDSPAAGPAVIDVAWFIGSIFVGLLIARVVIGA